jgi:hypothetical protein
MAVAIKKGKKKRSKAEEAKAEKLKTLHEEKG